MSGEGKARHERATPAAAVRRRVVSVREEPSEALLIEVLWGRDPALELVAEDSCRVALDRLQAALPAVPALVVVGEQFSPGQMGAWEFIGALKAHPTLGSVPVVVLCGGQPDEGTRERYRAQAASVLFLPMELAEIEATLRAIKEVWLERVQLPYAWE